MTQVIFQPDGAAGKDNYLVSNLPDSNRGGLTSILCGWIGATGAALRPVGEFDISSVPPGSTITAAALDIWITSAASGAFDAWVRRLIQPLWEELESTWNIAYTGANGWDGAGLVGGYFTTDDEQAFNAPADVGTPYWKTISGAGLAAQCQWALDNLAGRYMYEMMKDVEAGGTAFFAFSSSDETDADPIIYLPRFNPRPYLTINYEPPGAAHLSVFEGRMQTLVGCCYG